MANLIDKIKSGASKIGDKISSALRLEKTNQSEGIAPGATASTPAPAKPTFNGVPDFRPKLVVPYEYVASDLTAGPNAFIRSAQGIVFPYTPDIRQEQMANFNAKELTHSNYPFYFYQNSSVGRLTVSFRYTVQNRADAHYYLAMLHLFRSLTKMKFGTDPDAGSPPPICRFYAYGTYMFENLPVSVSSFNIDLDNNTDYFTLIPEDDPILNLYGPNNTIPILSTFQLSLVPIYSRAEMKAFSVQDFLKDSKIKGYI
jgi:hypothetical protein